MRSALLGWYRRHGRSLAIRGSTAAWPVLVSEVMAQQTQVSRVEPAWARFMGRFPSPRECASASTADVLRAWEGLGYNRRAVMLQRAARAIEDLHRGTVPADLGSLQALPGVGPYTARAVAAIAHGRAVAAVDTNVRRVVGRLTGSRQAATRLQAVADRLVDPADPAAWTHAMMDLGATVCVPRAPRCPACPIRRWCRTAASSDRSGMRPAGRPARASDARPARASGAGATGATTTSFTATSRWLRGRIVASLRTAERDAWTTLPPAMGAHGAASIGSAVDSLVRDGLVERRADGAVRLPVGRP